MKRCLTLLHLFVSLAIYLLCPLNSDAKIVFQAKLKHLGDTLYHIYAMEDDGSNLRRITDPNRYDRVPKWFPDGKRIVFERDWGEGKWNTGDTMHREFFIIDAIGMNEHSFMDNDRKDTNPVVSPDGRSIAFDSDRSGDLEIYTFNLESGQLKQLTNRKLEGGFPQFHSWSPDSKQLVYLDSGRGTGDNIWIMNADGSRKERITPIHHGNTILVRVYPCWSPSGKYIMYYEAESKPDRIGVAGRRLIIQNVSTGEHVVHNFPIPEGKFGKFGGLAWMGNDNTLLIAYQEPEDVYNIYRYDLHSRKMTKLTDFPLGHAYFPDWVKGSLAVSPLDKVATQWGYLKQVR